MLLYLYKKDFRFSYKAVAFVPYEMRPQLCRWVFRVTGVQEAGFPVTHNGH
jgi:elongation factor P hydroxylase